MGFPSGDFICIYRITHWQNFNIRTTKKAANSWENPLQSHQFNALKRWNCWMLLLFPSHWCVCCIQVVGKVGEWSGAICSMAAAFLLPNLMNYISRWLGFPAQTGTLATRISTQLALILSNASNQGIIDVQHEHRKNNITFEPRSVSYQGKWKVIKA